MKLYVMVEIGENYDLLNEWMQHAKVCEVDGVEETRESFHGSTKSHSWLPGQ